MKVFFDVENRSDAPREFKLHILLPIRVDEKVVAHRTIHTLDAKKTVGPGEAIRVEFEWAWPSFNPWQVRYKCAVEHSCCWWCIRAEAGGRPLIAKPGWLN